MKKASIIEEVKTGAVEISATSIDAFSDYKVSETGHRIVRVKNYEVVPAKKILNSYMGKVEDTGRTTNAFIRVDYRTSSGEAIEGRIYEKGVSFFMDNMARQSQGTTCGMKLSEVLKYFTAHDMDIWVSFSSQYGLQVKYFEPKEE